MPSRFEGLPLVAIEAAWAGVPVVATDTPGCREALPPDHPWMAPSTNATAVAETITCALKSPSQWPVATAKMQAWAHEHFTIERMAAGYQKFYHDVLNAPSSGA